MTGTVLLFGCSKKEPESPPPEPEKPLVRQPFQRRRNRPDIKLEYADDIKKLALEIAAIINDIETLEDAQQALATLKPLGSKYYGLKDKFSRHYLQDGGPAMNKLNNHPMFVQQAVIIQLQEQAALESSTVYDLYGKNLPKRMKFKVADAARFSGISPMMNRDEWEKWRKRINAPYIPPRSKIVGDPNSIADPNSFIDPNSINPNILNDPNCPWDPNSIIDPNRP